MDVLVTGAGGFVGQHLVKVLLSGGHRVVGGVLGGEHPPLGVLGDVERAAVRWIPLDVSDADEIDAALTLASPRWVFHLAGQSSVGSSFRDVLGTWEVNATGTLRLLVAIQRRMGRDSRVLVVSSGEVYGAVPEEEQPIRETRSPAPMSPYGASKLAAEVVTLQAVRAGGVDAVIARSFNHSGPGQTTRFALSSWADQLARISAGRAEPRLRVGNLSPRRDWLDVRDVVEAYLTLLNRGRSGEVYNVCSGTAVSLEELARMLVTFSDHEVELAVDRGRVRAVDIPLLLGDPGKLLALGWRPSIPFERTLRDLLLSAREQA